MLTRLALAISTTLMLLMHPAICAPPLLDVEIKSYDSPKEITLSCNNKKIGFLIHWNQDVGMKGTKRRHIFYRSDRDEHVILPVVNDSGTITGYENSSEMAKAVISETLRASRHDVIIVGVFPAGSDPVIGEWIDANFNYNDFSRAAEKVAKACSWDLSSYLRQRHALDTKPPASPDHTKIAPDDY